HGENHLPARIAELLRQLYAGLPGADEQHPTRREVVGAPVVVRVELLDRRRQTARDRRDVWPLERTAGDDDVAGEHRTPTGLETKSAGAVIGRGQARNV